MAKLVYEALLAPIGKAALACAESDRGCRNPFDKRARLWLFRLLLSTLRTCLPSFAECCGGGVGSMANASGCDSGVDYSSETVAVEGDMPTTTMDVRRPHLPRASPNAPATPATPAPAGGRLGLGQLRGRRDDALVRRSPRGLGRLGQDARAAVAREDRRDDGAHAAGTAVGQARSRELQLQECQPERVVQAAWPD